MVERTVTGYTLRSARGIIEAYRPRNEQVAETAIDRLEAAEKAKRASMKAASETSQKTVE